MKPLNIRFSEKVELGISDINALVDNDKSQSKIARAAMQIGIEFLKNYSESQESAFYTLDEYIELKNLKSLN
ncbi:MAG: hypothetical protein Unbinned6437contig1000_53 [Prokaryotic dsDNA virus sp.]|nr:MAG: hypothetical protein Unbinned6437contig1000_53 [Prokaryotic dsDNA virus sp.]|tara:strand:- start:13795 stop:14010 length:216 start_codon:yes stop_codon:yes gene_type:complete